MARTSQTTQIGKHRIELSNLEKVLFPADNIIKAELIDYYLKIAPTILSHLKGRPLSFLRYPDGIEGERFFQKNRPEWAPDWIVHVKLGSVKKNEEIDYITATDSASLAWLANLACIELHQMHCRLPHFDKPDYFVFDLDPPDDYSFKDVVGTAVDLKKHIENFGYYPFVKTTGRKGLHIVVPILPRWTFGEVFEAAREVARLFVESHSSRTTLHIKKEDRKGRLLVDVYRNRAYQTIVSAYSVRGVPGASVSMPVSWDRLGTVKSPADFGLRLVPQYVTSNGDAWEGIAAYAAGLHTAKKMTPKLRVSEAVTRNGIPGMLREYSHKRNFKKTPEPSIVKTGGDGNAFVVHRHHATRLHYDMRLERNGVLKSWAVPKGLPPRPGIMRLAVSTEDHPLEYINFEGKIPKGEYGAGEMWVYAGGRYEIISEKKNGFHFRLQSREITAEYKMHRTGEKEWMLGRLDPPQIDWLRDPIEPMLAQSSDVIPEKGNYLYEVKWDGIRALIALDEGAVKIHSRSRQDITERFPELLIPDQAFRATSALFDAEIVCLDNKGKPVFTNVIRRMQQSGKSAIDRISKKYPAVCYVFDCLYLDGRPIVNDPLVRRRTWMEDAIRKGMTYRISEAVSEGVELFEAGKRIGLEGIMAKETGSFYQTGRRSAGWLKIKNRHTTECLIIGYTSGRGDRKNLFGALQLAVEDGNRLRYAGKVGTGFDAKEMERIFTRLKGVKRIARPVKEKPPDDAATVWIEPEVVCEVQYASITEEGMLREPVFLRLRPDLDI